MTPLLTPKNFVSELLVRHYVVFSSIAFDSVSALKESLALQLNPFLRS